MLGTVLLVNTAALALYMLALWVLSLLLRDASIFDPGWGIGFCVVAWVAFSVGQGSHGRRLLLAILVSIWGLRLGAYLLVRKLFERGEDPRYRAMRGRYGRAFPLVSFGMVFLLQTALIWVISLPVQGSAPELGRLGFLDWAGLAVWTAGFLFEAVGDGQLWRFKADPSSRGRVLDRGLWRYTRHPNYFGDFMVWWGIYLIALSTGYAWWTIVGPLLISMLLIHGSGKRLLEARMSKRAGYADYVKRTSGFLPLPRRRSSR